MRSKPMSLVGVIVGAATLMVGAALLCSAPAAGSGSLCLSGDDAGTAMNQPVVTVLPVKYASGTNCGYEGAPKKGAAPRVTLTTWVSAQGLGPSIDGLKARLCKIAILLGTSGSKKSCAYAKAAVKEQNPVRLVRLLYALSNESGGAFDISGHIGNNPGYVWTPSAATEFTGSFGLFYEQREDRFVTVSCIAIYRARGIDPLCAQEAAKLLYAELTS